MGIEFVVYAFLLMMFVMLVWKLAPLMLVVAFFAMLLRWKRRVQAGGVGLPAVHVRRLLMPSVIYPIR